MNDAHTYLRLGDWNAVCFECGCKRKASELKRHWQGYYVCPEHWEPRQPQDFVRGVQDTQTPEWTQPMPESVYTFNNQFLGYGDGVTATFQLGDGLYPTNVTAVSVQGVSGSFPYTTTSLGGITFSPTIPPKGALIYATGTETAP